MKAGAQALVPTLEGSIFTDNAWSTLGLGWLGACIVLSGSPVAASALTLLDGGAIDQLQAFTMLTGSRLGAAFVVLVVGAIYAARAARLGRAARADLDRHPLAADDDGRLRPRRASSATSCWSGARSTA